MKKKIDNDYTKDRVFKYLFTLLYSNFFGRYLMDKREELVSIKTSREMDKFQSKTNEELRILIRKYRIPSHWAETLSDIVITGKMDLPYHEGISLTVGDYQIKQNGYDIETVGKSHAISVSINLTSKVSQTQIVQFVKDNYGLISKLEELLNLPEVKYPRLDNLTEGFHIHVMREHQKMSVGNIVKELQKEKQYSKIDPESLREKVKETAKDYKKYLQQKS